MHKHYLNAITLKIYKGAVFYFLTDITFYIKCLHIHEMKGKTLISQVFIVEVHKYICACNT